MLHVGISHKLLTSPGVLKWSKEIEITTCETATALRAVHKLPAIVP